MPTPIEHARHPKAKARPRRVKDFARGIAGSENDFPIRVRGGGEHRSFCMGEICFCEYSRLSSVSSV
jgi:hypothetical protein